MSMTEQAKKMAECMAKALDSKKGTDIQIIDISEMTIVAECFVVASGSNPLQVRALAQAAEDAGEETMGLSPLRKDGVQEGRWVVLDYGDVLVHIFHQEERSFYNLERLWNDGNNTTVYRA